MQALLSQNEHPGQRRSIHEDQADEGRRGDLYGPDRQMQNPEDPVLNTADVPRMRDAYGTAQPSQRGAESRTGSPQNETRRGSPHSIRRSTRQPAQEFRKADISLDVATVSEALRRGLIEHFYRAIYPIFPILPKTSFARQLDEWTSDGSPRNIFCALYYMLLAVSAAVLPEDDTLSRQIESGRQKSSDFAKAFYTHAASIPSNTYNSEGRTDINDLITQGLRSLYLVETGDATKAWITAGHAIRLYQGLEANHFTAPDLYQGDIRRAHGNLWWCLYILDRSLSTALGKPLAFDDDDCDTGLSDLRSGTSASGGEDATSPWFSVVADFHVTMGRIYTSIRSMRKDGAHSGRGGHEMKEALRQRIREYDAELQKYYTTQVMPKLRGSNQPVALQTIAVSSYYIGLVLLYRTSIETFTANEPDAFLRCAEAAAECIRVSPAVIASVPTSHFLVQQCRAIYASTKVLLHCMRMARNPDFSAKALHVVAQGLDMLQQTKLKWPEIKNYQRSAQADMQSTQIELQRHTAFSKAFDNFHGETAPDFSLYGLLPGDETVAASPRRRAGDSSRGLSSSRDAGRVQLMPHSLPSHEHSPKRRRVNEREENAICGPGGPGCESPGATPLAELGPLTNDFLLDFSTMTPDTTYPSTLFHDDSVFLSSIDSLLIPSEKWTS